MTRSLLCAALAVLLAGCGGRAPATRPPAGASPEASTPAAPRPPRVAVVDFARAARVHPRWPEVLELDRQIDELQTSLALTSKMSVLHGRVEVPRIDLTPEMKSAVERMRPEFQREADAVKAAARQEMDAYVAQLRADQQRQLETKRAAMEAELAKALMDKQQALTKDTSDYQQQVLTEYRLPLLNLRLKLESVQGSTKGEADRLNAQIQVLTKERDDKITAHEKANQQALQEFHKEQLQKSNAELQAFHEQMTKEGQRLVDERAAQLTARVRAQIEARQAEFNQRLKGQEQAIVAAARETQARGVVQAQTQVQSDVTKIRALQQQLQAVQRERARLFGVIFADLRVEAAALAQEKGWEVVLTQAIAAPGVVDATDELIARIRR
jgi:hypothetical protein